MRVLLGAMAAVLLPTSGAAAQVGGESAGASAAACSAAPAMPSLPDGANASREQMDAANTAFTTWALAYRNNLQCRRAEAEALYARWQARVAEHNALADALNQQHTAWEAEVAEFNDRSSQRSGSRSAPR